MADEPGDQEDGDSLDEGPKAAAARSRKRKSTRSKRSGEQEQRRTKGAAGHRPGSGAKSAWTALALGCVLLITVFITLCLVQQPSLSLAKCLRLFLALGAALISYLIAGKLAVEFQGKVAAGDSTGSETKIAGGGGFAVFLLLAVFYDPLDARPFLAQIGLVKPDPTVAAAQQVLHDERGYNPAVKGVADAQFVKEVAELQKEKGLSVTGVVDAQTLSALTHLQKGQAVIYRSKPAVLNTDGPGGSAAEDPIWQLNTALHDEHGQNIDSRKVPLITIPRDHFGADKVRLGDFAVVYWPARKKHAFAVVGDLGPKGKGRFEISPAVVSALDLPRMSPTNASYAVVAVIFAQTRESPVRLSPDVIKQKGEELLREWGGQEGGIPKLEQILASPNTQPTDTAPPPN